MTSIHSAIHSTSTRRAGLPAGILAAALDLTGDDAAPNEAIGTIDDQSLHQGILDSLPHLRAFAHLLARDHAFAEDLVQDTVVRALSCRHQFKPGTNLQGWLTVILRNRYFNELRRHSRKSELQIADLDIVAPGISGGQEENLEVRDFKRAFDKLPATHREALVLVGASGLSYEEAAEISGCRVGTMKSRVSRARSALDKMLRDENSAALAP